MDTNCNTPFDLALVAIPLIRVMRDARLSWAQREEIAWAIQECNRQYQCLMREHERHSQIAAKQQSSPEQKREG